ncbi:MAG: pseudomurein-binding repeat-containing protein [Methanothermobacter sp.]|nr:pseudomurein-binding repeat-containing protein [Methanothermobacter sp.]
MLLLFGIALVLNVSDVSAATGNNSTTLNSQATSQVSSQVTYTPNEVNDAATKVKNFCDANHRLPDYVTIKNKQVKMPQFLYLLTTDVVQTSQGSVASITLKNVQAPSNSIGTTKGGTLTRTEYTNLARNIKSIIDSTGRAPGNASTSIGQIKYETLVYIFAKIMDFQKTNKRLPNYVTVPSTVNGNGGNGIISGNGGNGITTFGNGQLNGLQGIEGLQILAKYINKNLNHQYGAATTAEGVERTGRGDCWGLSAWTAKVLHDNGYTVRIVQGASVEASNHRWVQVLINGKWINFDPSLVTRKYGSKPYYTTCASVRQIIATYYA